VKNEVEGNLMEDDGDSRFDGVSVEVSSEVQKQYEFFFIQRQLQASNQA
jgi:hypothetical protein